MRDCITVLIYNLADRSAALAVDCSAQLAPVCLKHRVTADQAPSVSTQAAAPYVLYNHQFPFSRSFCQQPTTTTTTHHNQQQHNNNQSHSAAQHSRSNHYTMTIALWGPWATTFRLQLSWLDGLLQPPAPTFSSCNNCNHQQQSNYNNAATNIYIAPDNQPQHLASPIDSLAYSKCVCMLNHSLTPWPPA